MGPRTRSFIATIGVVAFLIFWCWGAVMINEILPDAIWVDLIFFPIAGIGWGLPLIPLLRWAETGQWGRAKPQGIPRSEEG